MEDKMSVEERLKKCQAMLEERDANDVKFFFGNNSELLIRDVKTEVAEALEAVLADKAEKAGPVGDSVRK